MEENNNHSMPDLDSSHVAVSKGLLGILNETGRSNIQDPEKHNKVLHEAKKQHDIRKEFPDAPKPRTLGGKLGHHLAEGDHEKAADLMSGHPMVGLVGKSHLKSAMEQLAGPVMTQEPHPAALRGAVDYLSSASRGEHLLNQHVKSLVEGNKVKVEHNKKSTEQLKEHLDALNANPSSLLDAGGSLGHYLPDHGVQVAAMSANAVNYLNSIKPQNTQNSPLDVVLKPSKAAMSTYNRQVDIAQNPLLVLQHAKDGTLLPTDLATLKTVFPALHTSIVDKIGQQLIDVKTKGKDIPYKMRSSLSMLLGQPLDSTMTTGAMQAIIASAAPKGIQGPKKSAPATTLKAEDKANAMSETPLQSRLINKKQ